MVTKNNDYVGDIIVYESSDGQLSFNVNVFADTVWLTQKQMADLFGKARNTITEHVNNIFEEKELQENSVCRFFRHTAKDGKNYNTKYYNLDVIISVGYRVKSQRGTQFRQWATNILRQYLLSGYAIHEKRIKDIEDRIDNISTELRSELKKEIIEIHKSLLEIAKRPIVINNNNSILLGSHSLEEKIISLIDQIISDLNSDNIKVTKFKRAKEDIQKIPEDKSAKNRLIKFFKELGDENSDINKSLKGINKTRKGLEELIKLFNKLF